MERGGRLIATWATGRARVTDAAGMWQVHKEGALLMSVTELRSQALMSSLNC